jgi:hypothetical protein
MKYLPIALVILGVVIVAFTDKLQPDAYRKPKLNTYIGFAGGILWFTGVVMGFFNYKIWIAILIIFASFILAAIAGIKPNKQ